MLNSSTRAGSFFADYFHREEKKHICVAYVNSQNSIISIKNTGLKNNEDMFKFKKELIKDMLDNNAVSVVFGYYNNSHKFMHTDVEAKSIDDLRSDLKLVGVNLNDYIIINNDNTFYSLAENFWTIDSYASKNQLDNSMSGKQGLTFSNINNTQMLSKNIAGLTGIEEKWLNHYFNINPVKNIFENNQRNLSKRQKESLNQLKELKNLLPNVTYNEYIKDYVMKSSVSVAEYFKNYFSNRMDKEYFVLALLDEKDRIIKTEVAFVGTINESPVYPREIVKMALENKASSVILAHNHPGGSLKPSNPDIDVTEKLIKALQVVNVDVLDHIIIAKEAATSMLVNHPNLFNAVQTKRNTRKDVSDVKTGTSENTKRMSVHNRIRSAEISNKENIQSFKPASKINRDGL